MSFPGGPLISLEAEINQAVTTKKQGFKNSDGCKEAKPKVYHRVAPFPKSVPKRIQESPQHFSIIASIPTRSGQGGHNHIELFAIPEEVI